MIKRLSDNMLDRIADTLGISANVFYESNDHKILGDVDADLSLNVDTIELITAFQKIKSMSQRRACIDFIKALNENLTSNTNIDAHQQLLINSSE